MTPELYFIFDSHCPWSYASTPLVNALNQAYPDMKIHTLHCAHYNGTDCAGQEQMDAVSKQSAVKFGKEHVRYVNSPKNGIKTANFMAWLQSKQPEKTLAVLNALQKAHFIEGNPLDCKHDFNLVIEQFKLSPPTKIFRDKLSSEAEYILEDLAEIQEFIGTTAFPALLLLVGDKGVLLDHSLYLGQPEAMVEAVKQELK